MTTRTYGLLAGVIGSALWFWSRRRAPVSRPAPIDRGTVIFDNTPTATPLSSEGVI